MKVDHIDAINRCIDTLMAISGETESTVIECMEGVLLSEEECSQIRFSRIEGGPTDDR